MAKATSVKLKLLIDTKNQKVLFAEAGKDFVDFLIYLLSLPVGTVVRLLSEKTMVGSLSKLYQSIENLQEAYFQPKQNKNLLLNPVVPIFANATKIPLLLPADYTQTLYLCDLCYLFAYVPDLPCPDCGDVMTIEISDSANYKKGTKGKKKSKTNSKVYGKGFVKGMVTYMVMDDLEVKPMSSISSITLLKRFHVKVLDALEEKDVNVGMEEVLKLLKASMECKTVLTSVFISNLGA
ncbi:hypothetical protein LWI28_028786 [Acer negundo]|uniref:DUF674 domain-containing protein n=1 Tax=Acer negundo TaxID=4023 RepID=A0AAD5NIB5_ACENE|nr:hypothetical protein LWI28_028786 [Acer negundo]